MYSSIPDQLKVNAVSMDESYYASPKGHTEQVHTHTHTHTLTHTHSLTHTLLSACTCVIMENGVMTPPSPNHRSWLCMHTKPRVRRSSVWTREPSSRSSPRRTTCGGVGNWMMGRLGCFLRRTWLRTNNPFVTDPKLVLTLTPLTVIH